MKIISARKPEEARVLKERAGSSQPLVVAAPVDRSNPEVYEAENGGAGGKKGNEWFQEFAAEIRISGGAYAGDDRRTVGELLKAFPCSSPRTARPSVDETEKFEY